MTFSACPTISASGGVAVWIGEHVQKMPHRSEAGAFLVIRFNHRPRRVLGIGVKEHRLYGFGLIIPFI